MRMAPLVGLMIVALTVNVAGQGTPPPRRLPPPGGTANASSTQPVSPVAMATWKTRYDHTGQHTLQLLILWRGQPGWYLLPGRRMSSSGGNENGFSETSQFGSVELRLHLDLTTRVLLVQEQRVELGENNVVLVDSVDVPGKVKVVSLLRTDPEVSSNGARPDIEAFLAGSAEIMSFLRCDAQRPEGPPLRPLRTCVLAGGSGPPQ